MLQLDYTLPTAEQRTALLHAQNLSNLNAYQLELCANYILYPTSAKEPILPTSKPLSTREDKKNQELLPNLSAQEIIPKKGSNYYTAPKNNINWSHPALLDTANAITALQAKIDKLKTASDMANKLEQYKLKRWLTELRMEARLRLPEKVIDVHPTRVEPEPIDLQEAGLNWANSFHIKHVVRHYSELRQSGTAKWDVLYFDYLVEQTPLEPWEKHLFIRYIDGIKATVVARELAENFDKFVSPGYTSKVMRTIWRRIAETAEKEQALLNAANDPSQLRKCPRCGEKYPQNNWLFWRKGQRNCKRCLAS